MTMALGETIHGTLIVVGEAGLLITGASGQGKSSLAMALLARAAAVGLHARLVGDDRVRIGVQGNRLVGRGHPAIAGMLEARGLGLVRVDSVDSAIIRGVVTLDEAPARLPDHDEAGRDLLGIRLPRLALRPDQDLAAKADLVIAWLSPDFAIAKNS